jgi:hypothetical protein
MPVPALLPASYRLCLRITVLECIVAFSIALTPWVNLMPVWIALPDAGQPSAYTAAMTQGYGFWGAMWAIPSALMLGCTEVATLRRFARLAAALYLLWWGMWWGQMWNGTWHAWVLAAYLPLRAWQALAHLHLGWFWQPAQATPGPGATA